MKAIQDTAQKHLADQREYVKKRHLDEQRASARRAAGPSGLVDERMLAESMRSVRYQDEAHAAGDIIDNAIEAGASEVHIVYNVRGAEIEDLAFVDNGSGIDETFLPHSVKWGGSSNDGRRNVFGRFGFGLPSASVNRGRRFTVMSRTAADSPFKAVSVDLDHLETKDGVVQLPSVSEVNLPPWVAEYVATGADGKAVFPGGEDSVRTVVIWSSLDKLEWRRRPQSAAKFREHLGITYGDWLVSGVRIAVDGATVEPVDVLFTTPGHRWHDIPGSPNADSHSSIKFKIPDSTGEQREVVVRFSYLNVDAYDATAKSTDGPGRPSKIRKRIRSDYNGIFVTRNGRFIEVARPSFLTWNNYARQVGIALEFPPALDELFGVTPDKQTIMFTDRLTQILKSHGVERAFNALVADVAEERRQRKAQRDADLGVDGARPSELAIAKVVELDVRRTRKMSKETKEEAERSLAAKARKLAEESGVPEDEIIEAQEALHRERPYRVEFAPQTEDDPFYTPVMDGTQLVLRINTGHPWYRELYGRLGDAEQRSGLELMLWVLATSEIDSTGETRVFYRAERAEWSRRMADAFDLHPMVFHRASREELNEDDTAAWEEDADANAAE